MTEVIHEEDLILTGVGFDATLAYSDSIEQMVDNSTGIIMWIAANVIPHALEAAIL